MLFAAWMSLSFLLPQFGHTNSLSFTVKLSFFWPQLEQNFEVGNHLSKQIEMWLKQFYWKKKCLLRTHGYFVSTIGKVSEKIVFEYIGKQGK